MIKLSQNRIGEIFSLRDCFDYSTIVRAAQCNAVVEWIAAEGESVKMGTTRCIGDENGNFLNADDDIRDAHLRITTVNGWEVFLPMKEVASLVRRGFMVFHFPGR